MAINFPEGTQNLPSKIIQVKQSIKTDVTTTNSSGSFDISGLSVSITPSASDSKILVSSSVCGHTHNGMGGSFEIKRTIGGSATTLTVGDASSNRSRSSFSGHLYTGDGGGAAQIMMSCNTLILDTPSTTSAITYQVVMISIGSSLYCINRTEGDYDSSDNTRGISNITVMEVAA
tara:strand:+ start:467 stop:991 length:525 start_codon:yes stop_codon:yes gene_type:complete